MKDTYINKWTSISGPFGGTIMESKIMASGDNFGIPTVSDMTVKSE